MFYRVAKPALFRQDAETVHERVLAGLHRVSEFPPVLSVLSFKARETDLRLQVSLFGRTFATPLAVAAGLDKNGVAVPALCALGFGSVEVGTITLNPQPGNERPRIFR